jgi:hypothetical protein
VDECQFADVPGVPGGDVVVVEEEVVRVEGGTGGHDALEELVLLHAAGVFDGQLLLEDGGALHNDVMMISHADHGHSLPRLLPGHDVVELLLRHLPVPVQVCPLDHLLQLRLVDVVSQVLYHLLQALQRDEASVFFVEEAEDLPHVALGVLRRNAVGHQVQELLELHRAHPVVQSVRNHPV